MKSKKIKFVPADDDFRHVNTNDGTCSRCRRKLREDEIPLYMWPESDPNKMLIYCNDCLDLIKEYL